METAVEYFMPDLARSRYYASLNQRRKQDIKTQTSQSRVTGYEDGYTGVQEEKDFYTTPFRAKKGTSIGFGEDTTLKLSDGTIKNFKKGDSYIAQGGETKINYYTKIRRTYQNGQLINETEYSVVGKDKKRVKPTSIKEYDSGRVRYNSYNSSGEFTGETTKTFEGQTLRTTTAPTPVKVSSATRSRIASARFEMESAKAQAWNEYYGKTSEKIKRYSGGYEYNPKTKTYQYHVGERERQNKVRNNIFIIEKSKAIQEYGRQRTFETENILTYEQQKRQEYIKKNTPKIVNTIYEKFTGDFNRANLEYNFYKNKIAQSYKKYILPTYTKVANKSPAIKKSVEWTKNYFTNEKTNYKNDFERANKNRKIIDEFFSKKIKPVSTPIIKGLEITENILNKGGSEYIRKDKDYISGYGLKSFSYGAGVLKEGIKIVSEKPATFSMYAVGSYGLAGVSNSLLFFNPTLYRTTINIAKTSAFVYYGSKGATLFLNNKNSTLFGVGLPSRQKTQKVLGESIAELSAFKVGSSYFQKVQTRKAQSNILSYYDSTKNKLVVTETNAPQYEKIGNIKSQSTNTGLTIYGEEFTLVGKSSFKGDIITRKFKSVTQPRISLKQYQQGTKITTEFLIDNKVYNSIKTTLPERFTPKVPTNTKIKRIIETEFINENTGDAYAVYNTLSKNKFDTTFDKFRVRGVTQINTRQGVKSFIGKSTTSNYDLNVISDGDETLKTYYIARQTTKKLYPEFSTEIARPRKLSGVVSLSDSGVKETLIYRGGGVVKDLKGFIPSSATSRKISTETDEGFLSVVENYPRVYSVTNQKPTSKGVYFTSLSSPNEIKKIKQAEFILKTLGYTKPFLITSPSGISTTQPNLNTITTTQKITLSPPNVSAYTPRLSAVNPYQIGAVFPVVSYKYGAIPKINRIQSSTPSNKFESVSRINTISRPLQKPIVETQQINTQRLRQTTQQKTQQTLNTQSIQSLRFRSVPITPKIPILTPIIPPPPTLKTFDFDIRKDKRAEKLFKPFGVKKDYTPTVFSSAFGVKSKLTKSRKLKEQFTGLSVRPLAL